MTKNFTYNALSHIRNAFTGIPSMIWFLSTVSLINRSGAMVICFMTLYLTESLHFTIQDAGYAMSCYGIGAIIGAFVGGKWSDKFGYRAVMLWTLLGSGIFMLILMVVTSFWLMCATLLVLNIISEAFRPASSVSIRMNSSEEDRMRAFSLFRVFVNLAVTIALSLGGFLIGFGWKWIFICDAITCFGAAFLLFWRLPKEKNEPKKEVQKTDFQWISVDSALRDKDFVWFVLLTFLSAIVFMQIVWTVPPFFKQIYGWSESQIGLVSAINGLVVMLVEMPLIFQIQGKKSIGWFIRLGLVLYGLSYLALTLPIGGAVLWAILYMVIISFGEIFLMPFSSTWVTCRAPENRQGQYIALYTMAYSVSHVVAPLFGTQIIAHFGFDALWASMALISAVAWLGFYALQKSSKN